MHAKIPGIVIQFKTLSSSTIRAYAYVGRASGRSVCFADGSNKKQASKNLSRVLGEPSTLAEISRRKSEEAQVSTKSKEDINWLVARFRASNRFNDLAPKSKKDKLRYLEDFSREFGTWPVKIFEKYETGRDIAEWRSRRADKPRTADLMVMAVSGMFSWARKERLTKANPTKDLNQFYKVDRSGIVWTDNEVDRLLAACSTKELAWAIKLALETALRQGDLIKLPWSAIQGDAIVRKTGKKGSTVVLPAKHLRSLLDEIEKRSPVILTSRKGQPWTSDGLRSSFNKARKRAGIEGKDWHDFRGTAVTRLVIAGLSDAEICTWTGWSLKDVEQMKLIYVSAETVANHMLDRINSERE